MGRTAVVALALLAALVPLRVIATAEPVPLAGKASEANIRADATG